MKTNHQGKMHDEEKRNDAFVYDQQTAVIREE